MDRRSFLRGIIGAAVAPKLPTYFFAPIGGWKSDVIVNPLAVSVYEPLEILADPAEEFLPLHVWGLQYWQVGVGLNYLGLERSSYPLTPTLKGPK